jgi:hypothetical protein
MPMRPERNQPTVPYEGFDMFQRNRALANGAGAESTNISQGDNRFVPSLYPVE